MRALEYRYIVAAIYAVILFLDRLDLTIVNIALPTIANYYHVLVTDTEWVNNAFLLALAFSIPISSWIGDRYGAKRIFIFATALFGLTSLLCALAPNIDFLIAMRFMQGLSGGLIVPIGMSMVFRAFKPAEYASISSFIFIPSLLAPAISPALGGILIHYFSWQWVFLFSVPISALIVVFAQWKLEEYRVKDVAKLDVKGFALSSTALLLIFYVLSSIGDQGFTYRNTAILLTGLLLGAFFVQRERHTDAPLVDLSFFKKKLFVQANLIQMFFQIGHFGALFVIAIYLQIGIGHSPLEAGMIMGMQALGAICTSRLSVRLFERYLAKRPIMIGLTGVAIITPCILLLEASTSIWLGCLILYCRGICSGLCGAPMQTIGILGFKTDEVSRAAAVFNIIRQLSIGLGIALSSLLLNFAMRDMGTHDFSLLAQYDKSVFYGAFLLISISGLCGVYVTSRLDNKTISAHVSSA
ncbi:MAG: DHA2 family efflux MFS transporter permease subunit [Gammaproteobacteria bacterium]|nr:DHA2 family efflux MFS transporter permease subunit [Gammaproteobacteria bacterium]